MKFTTKCTTCPSCYRGLSVLILILSLLRKDSNIRPITLKLITPVPSLKVEIHRRIRDETASQYSSFEYEISYFTRRYGLPFRVDEQDKKKSTSRFKISYYQDPMSFRKSMVSKDLILKTVYRVLSFTSLFIRIQIHDKT